MKKALAIGLLLASSHALAFEGKVVGISDGDTLSVMNGGKAVRVRLAEIDAPEKAQAFGSQSKNALSALCFGKIATVDVKTTDKYGRSVGRVHCEGKDANAEQVKAGLAWAYTQYLSDQSIAQLETDAKNSKTGLWSDPQPTPPWDFRRGGNHSKTPRGNENNTQQTSQADADCGSKNKCGQMTSCAEARHYLTACGVSRLDRDGDGVPCESLCK